MLWMPPVVHATGGLFIGRGKGGAVSSRTEKKIRELFGDGDPALCPIPQPPKLMTMPERCGGERYIDYGDKWRGRNHPDNRIVCQKCGASWNLDKGMVGTMEQTIKKPPKRLRGLPGYRGRTPAA